jgi:TatD DNase family protein
MDQPGPSDFHCHLDDAAFDGRRQTIVADCAAAGFARLVTVADAYSPRSLELTAALAAEHPIIAVSAGAHPHQASDYSPTVEKRLVDFLAAGQVLALGEVGLDFHYDLSPRDRQLAAFRRQVAIAGEHGLPLVIHSRQAEAQVLKVLDEERFAGPVVFHCYTGSGADAAEIVQRGYFLSFSGIVTFRKADALRQVVAQTPLERLFSETDSPYLAPEPERGRTNTPLNVARVVERIAAIKGTTVAELQQRIAANYQGLRR